MIGPDTPLPPWWTEGFARPNRYSSSVSKQRPLHASILLRHFTVSYDILFSAFQQFLCSPCRRLQRALHFERFFKLRCLRKSSGIPSGVTSLPAFQQSLRAFSSSDASQKKWDIFRESFVCEMLLKVLPFRRTTHESTGRFLTTPLKRLLDWSFSRIYLSQRSQISQNDGSWHSQKDVRPPTP